MLVATAKADAKVMKMLLYLYRGDSIPDDDVKQIMRYLKNEFDANEAPEALYVRDQLQELAINLNLCIEV